MSQPIFRIGELLARWARPVVIVDAATGAPVSGGGGGGGDATAAKQDEQTAILEDIREAAEDANPAQVVGYLNTGAATPTVSATPDYSANDAVGGVMTFAAILRGDARSGYVVYARITAKTAAASMAQIDVLIFNADPSASTVTDNSAFVLADADRAKLKGVIKVTSFDVVGASASIGYAEGRVPVTGAVADDLYAVMVARGAINLGATDDLILELTVDQN